MHWTDYPLVDDHLRASVRAEMEIASGESISVSNPLPDECITACQIEGIPLSMLNLWIHSGKGEEGWSAPALVRWYRAINAVRAAFRATRIEAA